MFRCKGHWCLFPEIQFDLGYNSASNFRGCLTLGVSFQVIEIILEHSVDWFLIF